MADPDPSLKPLALRRMPEVAAVLRNRRDVIINRWTDWVREHLPDADPLTLGQVRDSIPNVLATIASALEHDDPEATMLIAEIGQGHGIARAQMHFKIDEFVTEYRMLRHIVIDEIADSGARALTLAEVQAISTGIELAMQAGVISFIRLRTERLKEAAESESRYVSFLSHDVRNNLNSAMLMIELLSRRLAELPGLEDEAADVDHLKRSIRQTVEGMDRVLQAERVRRQAIDAQLGPVELHELADELIEQHHNQAEQKGLTVENQIPPPARVHSERSVLSLALQNLLGNAIKYSESGTITLGARQQGDTWHIYVRDEGVGISPDHVKRLFRAFSRGETHGQSGVGLGLYIASHAIRTLGSELKVESELGKGSTFYADLPAAPAVGDD